MKIIISVVLFFLIIVGIVYLQPKNVDVNIVNVGFIGDLNGKHSNVGKSGKDGAKFFIDNFNKNSNDLKVDLYIYDIDPKNIDIKDILKFFEKNKIDFVIGPMLSNTAKIIINPIFSDKVLFISPIVASPLFYKKDDNLIRVYNDVQEDIGALAECCLEDLNSERAVIIYDKFNSVYTEYCSSYFTAEYNKNQKEIINQIGFNSIEKYSIKDIVSQVPENTDVVFIIASSMETSIIVQNLKKKYPNIKIVSTVWSVSDDILHFGGNSVEGMIFMSNYNRSKNSFKFNKFKKDFQFEYGYEPDFSVLNSYDAASILLRALKENKDKSIKSITNYIINKNNKFECLQGIIDFDEFGDVKRKLYKTTIKDGQFVHF